MKRFSKKTWVAVAVVAVVAIAAIGGYAYWTTSGTGSGSATTDTSSSFVVSQTGSVTGLVPGGADQDISINVNNPASHNQYLSGLTVAVKNSDGSAWSAQADSSKPACTKDDFSLTQPASPAGDLSPGDHSFTAKIHMLNGSGNQDNCKSVTVPLYFSAS